MSGDDRPANRKAHADAAGLGLLSRLARSQRDHIALLNGFNEPMARRIAAASRFFLMPSRFEPCGLMQMQAQRYGSLPIAHATGGLADTIEDGTTSFLFSNFSAEGLYAACRRAFAVFADTGVLKMMRQTAMSRRFHWLVAAERYEALYSQLISQPAVARTGLMPPPMMRPIRRQRGDQLRAAA